MTVTLVEKLERLKMHPGNLGYLGEPTPYHRGINNGLDKAIALLQEHPNVMADQATELKEAAHKVVTWWNGDEMMRLDSFNSAINRLEAAIAAMGESARSADITGKVGVVHPSPASDEQGRPLKYWGGLKNEWDAEAERLGDGAQGSGRVQDRSPSPAILPSRLHHADEAGLQITGGGFKPIDCGEITLPDESCPSCGFAKSRSLDSMFKCYACGCQWYPHTRTKKQSPVSQWTPLRHAVHSLWNEIDCRIEHGANSGGHLEFISNQLKVIMNEGNDSYEE